MHQIQFSIHKDMAALMLDTSGQGLHKRGYRANSTLAPIKETLAAGIIDLAHVRRDTLVIDPFCGSGHAADRIGTSRTAYCPGNAPTLCRGTVGSRPGSPLECRPGRGPMPA